MGMFYSIVETHDRVPTNRMENDYVRCHPGLLPEVVLHVKQFSVNVRF